MKKYKIWFWAGVVCFVLGVSCIAGVRVCSNKTKGIEATGISTGDKNSCMAYDTAEDILFVGTHDNQIVAFKNEKEVWRARADGAFSELVVNEATGLVYAGNEDNHIYAYQVKDGTLKMDIDAQRRVLSIDVTKDGKEIAAATVTGTSKSNVLLYQTDGTQIQNLPYKIKILGIRFCEQEDDFVIVNNRGELIKMNHDGEEISSYKTNYSIMQMLQNNQHFWVVCKNGSYFEFDNDLKKLRSGVVTNNMQAVIKSIGVDSNGNDVLVGTEEGYLFVMNEKDKQIFQTNIGTEITGFAAIEDQVYLTGLGDFVKVISIGNVEQIECYQNLSNLLNYTTVILFAVVLVCLLMTIPLTNQKTTYWFKQIWKHRMAYLMLLPTFVLVFLFNYRGIGIAFVRSFTNWSTTNNTVAKMDFVGLENFQRMLTEGYFLIGMKNLILLVSTGILKVLTVPLLVAWLVYSLRGDKRKYVHRFLFVLPIVVPGVIAALTWQKIYDPSIGLLNQILGAMHLEGLQRVWLGDAKTAIWAVIFMGFPFVQAMAFLVYYGGLIGIGKEIEESAMVDGASRSKIFWGIQLPMIKPQLSIMVTLTIIGAMQDFNGIYILTGGGPGTSTYVPALELYLNVAQFGRYGYACALGVVLFMFTMIVTLTNMRLGKEKE